MKRALLALALTLCATAVKADTISYTITPEFDTGDSGPSVSFSVPQMPGKSFVTTTILFNGIEEPNFTLSVANEPAGEEMSLGCPQSEGCFSPDGVWLMFAANLFSGDVNNPTLNAGTFQASLSPHETLAIVATDVPGDPVKNPPPVDSPEPSTAWMLAAIPFLFIRRKLR